MTKRPRLTADQIVNRPVAGNHHSDRDTFTAVDDFVMDPRNSLEDKGRVLKFLAKDVMGINEDHMTNQQVLNAYMNP